MDDNLLAFIRSSIRSVWSLELLLLVRRDSDRSWSPDELVRELRGSRKIVSNAVSLFVIAGIMREQVDGFRYGPAHEELEHLIAELAREYEERPVFVINTIVREQRGKLQDFADAFRITRGD